jgi:hypothetical protein
LKAIAFVAFVVVESYVEIGPSYVVVEALSHVHAFAYADVVVVEAVVVVVVVVAVVAVVVVAVVAVVAVVVAVVVIILNYEKEV